MGYWKCFALGVAAEFFPIFVKLLWLTALPGRLGRAERGGCYEGTAQSYEKLKIFLKIAFG